jgi:CRISPR type IV-associated protein Csf3
MYEPIQVTAYLQCGVVTDFHLPLDGVLLFQAMRERYGPQIVTVPGAITSADLPRLPITTRGDGRDWYYAASFAQWGACADGADHWNKRFDQKHGRLVDFDGKRGKVIVEQGAYKAYHMPVAYRHALAVSWYLMADRAWIESVLRMVTHLGKKAAQGWGAVKAWNVTPWHADWSERDESGRLMRAVPQHGGVRYGIRPPYWLPAHQVPCVMPS